MAQRNVRQEMPEKRNNSGLPIIIIAAVALLFELCFFGVLGTVGGWVRYGFFGLFGLASYVLPPLVLVAVIFVMRSERKHGGKIFCGIIFFLFLCTFLHMVSYAGFEEAAVGDLFKGCAENATGGGIFGGVIALGMAKAISTTGAYIVTILVMIVCLLIICEAPLLSWFRMLFSAARYDDYDEYEDDDYYEEEVPDKIVRTSGRRSYERPSRREKEPLPRYDDAYDYEYEERPLRRDEDNVVYETTSEEGVTIRIVNGKRRRRRPRAELVRSQNKAAPMRADGGPETVRSQRKAKGISDSLDMAPGSESIDEIREITKRPEPEKKEAPKKPERAVREEPVTAVAAAEAEAAALSAEPKVKRSSKKPAEKITSETQIIAVKPKKEPKPKKESKPKPEPESLVPVKPGEYVYPPLSLLNQRKGKPKGTSEAELDNMARNLEVILSNFGVAAKVIDRQVGPTVTRYELQPEMGTRVSKITSLVDDLKLNLAVSDIRIEAPIPGRAAIGIEIPNEQKDTVLIREILEAPELINHKSKIAFAAGVDISGNVVVADIAKMPHLLVAGTTGSGKSVFMNSIIMAILFRAKPSEVGLIIIDPKKIEFGVYSGIPHLVKDVVTDPGQAVSTLRWAVNEMTNRYQRMQLSGVRDFKSYNEKFDKGTLNSEEENPKRMPQIVIMIDELADLMMVASKEAEALICRLAQLARAAGIHLIIATQRPSVDVVTGLIKANIPGRVALLVASQVDSRTIIDMKGAEELLGYGDMLFYPTGYTKPLRVQGAFVSDDEVADVVAFLKQHKTEDYFAEEAAQIAEYMNNTAETQSDSGSDSSGGGSGLDEYLFEAGKLCIEMGKASSSMLQRHFSVGFNRAARIIDQLTEMGAVGPANGAKPREILVDLYTFEEMFQSKEE